MQWKLARVLRPPSQWRLGLEDLHDLNGLNHLKQLLQMSQKVLEDSLTELTKLAIPGSHSIWCTRNSTTSQNT